ncbi:hypothetical protein F383_02768 [Gossypium arboreum]|uniref:Uncharacterized protein n=1 Tax=Gossypium arboreum TaxID=29729 RepID=A0A0B0P821_GOSAR|nr:hypothetical protein F383_02768 [Gossypium arboreum]
MYYQSNKTSPQLDLIDDISVFQSVYLFSIRLRTCLSLSTKISYLFLLRSNHVISISISLNIRQSVSQYLHLFCFACKSHIRIII